MSTTGSEQEVHFISVIREIEIAAPIEIAFDAMLEEIGPCGQLSDGSPFPMVLEAWPGGRWLRDLGDNQGHFWGHVQVIKAPALLLWGDSDPISQVAVGERLNQLLPTSELRVIAGAGHDLAQTHVPEVADLIGAHLRT